MPFQLSAPYRQLYIFLWQVSLIIRVNRESQINRRVKKTRSLYFQTWSLVCVPKLLFSVTIRTSLLKFTISKTEHTQTSMHTQSGKPLVHVGHNNDAGPSGYTVWERNRWHLPSWRLGLQVISGEWSLWIAGTFSPNEWLSYMSGSSIALISFRMRREREKKCPFLMQQADI